MLLTTPKVPLPAVGDYDLLHKIADGGVASVYRGRHRATGAAVAVKLVPASAAGQDVVLRRLRLEFDASRELDHPHLVRALDFGRAGPFAYLVLEFVDGDSLGERIHRTGRLPEGEAVRLAVEVARGLVALHGRGLIHRDVKPDNILVTPDGRARLADLGLVKEAQSELNLTRTGRGLGTPHFMAPEQFHDAKGADPRYDVYGLGATLYMAVTAVLPFGDTNLLNAWMRKLRNDLPPARELAPGLSTRVDWAIRRAMSADPARRPASCDEFIEDLTGRGAWAEPAGGTGGAAGPEWHLAYTDESGARQSARGSTEDLRRSLRDGLLGDAGNVSASREEGGPFRPLREHPEFRDLLIEPAPLPTPCPAPQDRAAEVPPPGGAALVPSAASQPPARLRAPGGPTGPAEAAGAAHGWPSGLVLAALALGGFVSGLWWLAR
jgi:eukaryotic-like serine/threonine-protein kinase